MVSEYCLDHCATAASHENISNSDCCISRRDPHVSKSAQQLAFILWVMSFINSLELITKYNFSHVSVITNTLLIIVMSVSLLTH